MSIQRRDPELPFPLAPVFTCVLPQYRDGIPVEITPRQAFEISQWCDLTQDYSGGLSQNAREAIYHLRTSVTFHSRFQELARNEEWTRGDVLTKVFNDISTLTETLTQERAEAALFREKMKRKVARMERRIENLELGSDGIDSEYEPEPEDTP